MSWKQYIQDGTTAVWQGDFASAEKLLKLALQFAKEHFSQRDSRTALTLSLLGHVYFRTGDYARAEKLLEPALKMHTDSKFLNDPCVLMDLYCLAQIKSAAGKNDEACRLLDDTMDKLQSAHAFQPQIVAYGIGGLMQLASEIRNATTSSAPAPEPKPTPASAPEPEPAPAPPAAPAAPEPLPLPQMELKQTANPGDIWQQQFQTGLASMKTDDAEYDELITAYLNFESAYRLATDLFPADDMRLIATIKGLADASTKLRLFDQAENLYRQAIGQAKSSKANAAAAGNSIRLALGFMYVEAGRFSFAKSIFDEENIDDLPREAEPLRKRVEHAVEILRIYDQAQNLISQAEVAEQMEDFDKAAKLANTAVSQLKQAFPPQHIEHARVLRYRSSLLRKIGNDDQATELEKRAERIEKSNRAQEDEWVRRTAELPRIDSNPVPV